MEIPKAILQSLTHILEQSCTAQPPFGRAYFSRSTGTPRPLVIVSRAYLVEHTVGGYLRTVELFFAFLAGYAIFARTDGSSLSRALGPSP